MPEHTIPDLIGRAIGVPEGEVRQLPSPQLTQDDSSINQIRMQIKPSARLSEDLNMDHVARVEMSGLIEKVRII